MKKIITTIILALLTSPVFADFTYVKGNKSIYGLDPSRTLVMSMYDRGTVLRLYGGMQFSLTNQRIKFQVDEGDIISYQSPVHTPEAIGLSVKFSNILIDNMSEGRTLHITFVDSSEQVVSMELPLKYFDCALRQAGKDVQT